jgi:hypothetical protein
MNPFTDEELDKLYEYANEQLDDIMHGDWEVVKQEVADLHLLMAKLLKLQYFSGRALEKEIAINLPEGTNLTKRKMKDV